MDSVEYPEYTDVAPDYTKVTPAAVMPPDPSSGILPAIDTKPTTPAALPTAATTPAAATTTTPTTTPATTTSASPFAKVGVIVLGLFVLVLAIKFGVSTIAAMLNPTKVELIKGMINGTETIIIYQDPSVPNAIEIPRSNNTADGIEFTYSVWLYLLNPSSNSQQLNHIFNKGNGVLLPSPLPDGSGNYIINAPGVYVTNINEIIIVMNTYTSIDENISIPNLPINKWFNLMIRCNNTTLDAFINGNITQSIELLSIPKQNYGNLNIALNNGFQGYLSDLTYYAYILGTKEITDIVKSGPTTTQSSMSSVNTSSSMFVNNFGYLSTRWYFGGVGDMYNPKGT